MCGIFGYIGKNYQKINHTFLKYLVHRGPDGQGNFYDEKNNLILGHTRLSIIDLSSQAHQPMIDEYKNYVLVFNGEIYNYKDIKKELKKLEYYFKTTSDTEVLLKGYIKWGEKILKKLRGMFAFCIYDKRKKQLFLARDRFGIKPLIYAQLDNEFIFSSELRPILHSNFCPKKLNYQAINEYFTFGSIRQPNTILKNFYTLMPSHYMIVDIKSLDIKIKKYYDYIKESQKYNISSYTEAVNNTRKSLEEATRIHLVADVDVGAFLSGGIDSTTVVALMKQYKENIHTFSVGFVNKTEVFDETGIATRTAKYLGTIHHNIKIDDKYIEDIFDDFINNIDQPSIDGINTYIVSRETAKELKVALSGLGGDEIFAGYPHFKSIMEHSHKKNNLLSVIGKQINKIKLNRWTNKYKFYGLDEYKAVEIQRTINKNLNFLNQHLRHTISKIQYPKLLTLSPIQKVSCYEINNYLLNTLLRDTDVLSMANSLEVRPILLDHKLVELAFSLNDNYKIKNGRLKAVFIDSVKDIIPNEVWQRKKTGFEMPFALWMNGRLNKKFLKAIQNKKLRYIFQQNFLNKLKRKIMDKKLKRNDWMFLVFCCWLENTEVDL